MKPFPCVTILVIGLFLISCDTKPSAQNGFITKEYPRKQVAVKNLIREIYETAKQKDLDKLDAYHLYGPKFTKFDDWEPLGRQDSAGAQKSERDGFGAIDTFTYELEELKVDVFDNVAISTFILDYSIKAGEESFSARARSTLVFVNIGDSWKITHEHFSPFKSNP